MQQDRRGYVSNMLFANNSSPLNPVYQFLCCLSLCALVVAAGCAPAEKVTEGRTYVATIHPLATILEEIVGDRGQVIRLLPPGASPHTYEIRPSDARTIESAAALFYIDRNLDAWATKLSSSNPVGAFEMLPEDRKLQFSDDHDHEHAHGEHDPHFWTDPLTVQALLPKLVEELTRIDPDGAQAYQENANRFHEQLDELHEEIQATLSQVSGTNVIALHPALRYFLQRYTINVVATIEPSPGKEPTPKSLANIIEMARKMQVKAILTEPQLPRAPAEIIAEELGVAICEVDPIGGVEGRMSYRELLLYNAHTIREALQ